MASIPYGPGVNVILCGNVNFPTPNSPGFKITADGSASEPIRILFDKGASLTSPQFNGCLETGIAACDFPAGAIYDGGHNYIFIDCNGGVIQNTANGEGLTHHTNSVGIWLAGANHLVRNCVIQNIFKHPNGPTADKNGGGSFDIVVHGASGSSIICNNKFNNAETGAQLTYEYSTSAVPATSIVSCHEPTDFTTIPRGTLQFAYNSMDDHCWGSHMGGQGAPLIFGNKIMTGPLFYDNWKLSGCHEDGILVAGHSRTTFFPQFFWNYFQGYGSYMTSPGLYLTYGDLGDGSGESANIYENIFYSLMDFCCTAPISSLSTKTNPHGPFKVYNNLIIDGPYMTSFSSTDNVAIDSRNNIMWSHAPGNNGYFYYSAYGTASTFSTATLNGNDYFGGRFSNTGDLAFGVWNTGYVNFAKHKANCRAGGGKECESDSITTDPLLAGETGFNTFVRYNDGSAFYESASSPTRNIGDNLSHQCPTLVGLCVSPPQYFGYGSTCGTGCTTRPESGPWDAGPYQY